MDRQPYDPRAIANFLLREAWSVGRHPTNLSINKLIYFAHGWSLVTLRRPMQRECFEAWPRGPVIRSVYGAFKRFRFEPITEFAVGLDLKTGGEQPISPDLHPDDEEFVREVFHTYSRLTAWQLVELSHVDGGPWDQAIKSSGGVTRGVRIEDREIERYFDRHKGLRAQ